MNLDAIGVGCKRGSSRHRFAIRRNVSLAERLAEEPRGLTDVLGDEGLADAYLAGIADHLSRAYKLRPPDWVSQPERVLAKPWFALNSHGGRMAMLIESPPAFRERNIFISANALNRA